MKQNRICIKKTHILISILALSVFAIVVALRNVSNSPTIYKSRASESESALLLPCGGRVGDACCTKRSQENSLQSYCDTGLACYKKNKQTKAYCIAENLVLEDNNSYLTNKIAGFHPGTDGFPCLMRKTFGASSDAMDYKGACIEMNTKCYKLAELSYKQKDKLNLQPWYGNLPDAKELASPFDDSFFDKPAMGGVCVKKKCGSEREEVCYDDNKPYCHDGWRLNVRYIEPANNISNESYLGCVDTDKDRPIKTNFSQNGILVQPVSVNNAYPDTADTRFDLISNKKYDLELSTSVYSKTYSWSISCNIALNSTNTTNLSYSSSERRYIVKDIISECGLTDGHARMKISLSSDESPYPMNREILIN
jgi:hypothetical protein